MLVSCSDRGAGAFSSAEKEKSLIIFTVTLDHSLSLSWVYLWSVHFHPDWVSSASVSIYKACGLRARSYTDLKNDRRWCEGLEVEKVEQSRHGSSICAFIKALVFTLTFILPFGLETKLRVQRKAQQSSSCVRAERALVHTGECWDLKQLWVKVNPKGMLFQEPLTWWDTSK